MAEEIALDSMGDWHRTHYCGEIGAGQVGEEVVVAGWVHRRRDHGGVLFVDLRDRTGIVQLVFNPDINPTAFSRADLVHSEWVIAARGKVSFRPAGMENPHLATGTVEIYPDEVRILNTARTPPFYITDGDEVDETVRLRYRYLDLRRPALQRNIMLRHRIVKIIRDYFDSQGFLEIETPVLTKSTPEGARDFLVPSRLNPGTFYALPQSPQLFKQLLMVAGFDRYFQVVKVFRDEDLRGNRQPEFTQVDVEMSFPDRDEIFRHVEAMMAAVYKGAIGIEIKTPFPRMSWQEAMDRYGSDKPDLRFGMAFVDLAAAAGKSTFEVFRRALATGGQVKGVVVPGGAAWSRKTIDQMENVAKDNGAGGLAWAAWGPDGVRSPIAKYFPEGIEAMLRAAGAAVGDLLLVAAGPATVVARGLGAVRLAAARQAGLIPTDQLAFTWVIDFPLFSYSEEEGRLVAEHHPFTAPHAEDMDLIDKEPLRVRSWAYDLVLNGEELASGSIRIHRRDIQDKVFRALGFTQAEAQERFGFLLEAFEYGAPPHGGIALGLDRMVALMAGTSSIRDVIAFPKTTSGADLMVRAPATVDKEQLDELHIRVKM